QGAGSRWAVLVAERYADGLATEEELQSAFDDSFEALCAHPGDAFAAAAHAATYEPPLVHRVPGQIEVGFPNRERVRAAQAALLRCVFGNPSRPPLVRHKPPHSAKLALAIPCGDGWTEYDYDTPAAWLAWNNGTVPKLAEAIYQERRWQDLPVLADALLDAGCP